MTIQNNCNTAICQFRRQTLTPAFTSRLWRLHPAGAYRRLPLIPE